MSVGPVTGSLNTFYSAINDATCGYIYKVDYETEKSTVSCSEVKKIEGSKIENTYYFDDNLFHKEKTIGKDLRKLMKNQEILLETEGSDFTVEYSPNLKSLFCATKFGLSKVDLETNTSSEMLQLPKLNGPFVASDIQSIDYSQMVIARNRDILLIDPENAANRTEIKDAHGRSILNVSFNPTDPFLFCSSSTDYW